MNLIDRQFVDLRKKYQYLYKRNDQALTIIDGTILFDYCNIKDRYEIEINISNDYPKTIPLVCETKGKIPKDWHHNGKYFCLETPFRVWEIFRKQETLLNFVDNLVVPYLASYSYFKNTGDSSKEHSHGARGVLDDYKKYFNIKDDLLAFKLLRVLAEGDYRGHISCPCGSGKNLRKCHGKCIQTIVLDDCFKDFDFMQDYLRIGIQLKNDNIISDLSKYTSKEVFHYLERIKNNPRQKWGY
jgi:hypothetical protein